MSVLADRLRRAPREDFDPTAAADQALLETVESPSGGRSAAGDPQALRGIPMIGRCAGAIPGTRPQVTRTLGRWSER
jgi:hypothetical protein